MLVQEARLRVAESLVPSRKIKFLDFGCGSGEFAKRLSTHGHTGVGIDPAPRLIEAARIAAPDIEFRVGSLDNWPDGKFDVIFALSVLFFLDESDEELFFKKSLASLEEGGIIICSYINKFADYASLNEYTVKFYREEIIGKFDGLPIPDLEDLFPNSKGDKSFKNVSIHNRTIIRTSNPFNIERRFRSVGFDLDELVFSRFYFLPPDIVEREENIDLFKKQIEITENLDNLDLGPVFGKTMTCRVRPA